MDLVIDDLDAWRGILDELQAVTGGKDEESRRLVTKHCRAKGLGDTTRPASPRAKVLVGQADRKASIRIVEWSERSLTIVWHDPTACSYVDQRWTRSKSISAGVCALTGEVIRRGQDIFKPSGSRPPPANAGAMILVSALPVILNESEVVH
jgi:hypothetical protein